MSMEQIKELIDSKLNALAEKINRPAERTTGVVMHQTSPDSSFRLAQVALTRAAHSLGYDPAEYWRQVSGGETFSPWVASGEFRFENLFRSRFDIQSTLSPELGGALVAPDFASMQIQEFLRPASVVRRNISNVVITDGVFPMARMSEGTEVAPVGEGRPVRLTGYKLEVSMLTPKKLAGMVPITSESIKAPKFGVLQMIQNDLVAAMAFGQDKYLLLGDGTQHQPTGLKTWAGTQLSMTTPVNVDNIQKDLSALRLALLAHNIPLSKAVWFMSPRTENFLMQVNNGVLYIFRDEMVKRKAIWGIPYEVTTAIPDNLGISNNESFIILADMSFAVLVDSGTVDVQVSRDATFSDGTQIISSFQNDLVLVRIIAKVDLGMRHPKAVAVLNGVTWGA